MGNRTALGWVLVGIIVISSKGWGKVSGGKLLEGSHAIGSFGFARYKDSTHQKVEAVGSFCSATLVDIDENYGYAVTASHCLFKASALQRPSDNLVVQFEAVAQKDAPTFTVSGIYHQVPQPLKGNAKRIWEAYLIPLEEIESWFAKTAFTDVAVLQLRPLGDSQFPLPAEMHEWPKEQQEMAVVGSGQETIRIGANTIKVTGRRNEASFRSWKTIAPSIVEAPTNRGSVEPGDSGGFAGVRGGCSSDFILHGITLATAQKPGIIFTERAAYFRALDSELIQWIHTGIETLQKKNGRSISAPLVSLEKETFYESDNGLRFTFDELLKYYKVERPNDRKVKSASLTIEGAKIHSTVISWKGFRRDKPFEVAVLISFLKEGHRDVFSKEMEAGRMPSCLSEDRLERAFLNSKERKMLFAPTAESSVVAEGKDQPVKFSGISFCSDEAFALENHK